MVVPKAQLQLTGETYRWLAGDSAWRSLPPMRRAGLAWQARLGSMNWAISRRLAADLQTGVPENSVVVVGLWRSGTTLMHELLAAATGFPAPETWQCMNAANFRLRGRPARMTAIPRPMDGMRVGSTSPQEDEFALLTLGVPSAYRAFLMPHRLAALNFTLDQLHWRNDSAWFQTWEDFLKVAMPNPHAPKPWLLKSPGHTFRLQAILRRHPSTRIVWMARDPTATFHSNLRMWREMFALYGLTAYDNAALQEFLAAAFVAAAEALRWCKATLPAAQFAVVPLESLERAPENTAASLCEILSLPLDRSALHRRVVEIGVVPGRPYTESLPDAVRAALATLDQAIASRI